MKQLAECNHLASMMYAGGGTPPGPAFPESLAVSLIAIDNDLNAMHFM